MNYIPVLAATIMFFISWNDLRKTNMNTGNRAYYVFLAVMATYYAIEALLSSF